MNGIHYWIEKRAEMNPQRLAIITEEQTLTYEELHLEVRKVATYLREEKSIKKGDRIAILSHNNIEFVVLLFAIAKLEAVAVPLNVRLNNRELAFQLKDSGTKLLFIEEAFANEGQALVETMNLELASLYQLTSLKNVSDINEVVDEEAAYIICYTSGTTGKPKGAVLTQKNMYYNALNNVTTIDISSYDRTIVLLPFFHIGGIGLFAFPTLFAGGTIIIPGKFQSGKTIQLIEQHKITIVMGVPSIHQALINDPSFDTSNLSSVRWFYSGGAPCPHRLIQQFYEKGFLFGQGFGLTETSPTVFLLSREDAPKKIGSIGKPVLFCEFRLVDEAGADIEPEEIGHLLVRGGNVMKGYWNNPSATKEAMKEGWFHTGDLAQVDDEGFVYIVGRKKEMIISGGENIYPLEIEHIINRLEAISEVAVIGRRDEKWGEVPIAFVAVKNGMSLKESEIITHCATYLGKYKVPKEIIILQSLPKNSTGKIQKNKLEI